MRSLLDSVSRMGLLAGLLLAPMMSAPANALTDHVIERQGRRADFMRALMRDEIEVAFGGGPSLTVPTGYPKPDVVTTAVDLAGEFRGNELAADRKIRDNSVSISGTVESVRLDTVTRQPITQLAINNSGLPIPLAIQARMAKDAEDHAEAFRPGQRVRLRCTGGGKAVFGIFLRDCRDEAVLIREISRKAGEELMNWLADGTEPTSFTAAQGEKWKESMHAFYWLAGSLPERSPCFVASLETPGCKRDIERLFKGRGPRPEVVAMARAHAIRLGIPVSDQVPLPAAPPAPPPVPARPRVEGRGN